MSGTIDISIPVLELYGIPFLPNYVTSNRKLVMIKYCAYVCRDDHYCNFSRIPLFFMSSSSTSRLDEEMYSFVIVMYIVGECFIIYTMSASEPATCSIVCVEMNAVGSHLVFLGGSVSRDFQS